MFKSPLKKLFSTSLNTLRSVLLGSGLLLLYVQSISADQLQLMDEEEASEAVEWLETKKQQALREGELFTLVLYCSECNSDTVERWEVKTVQSLPENFSNYHGVYITARKIQESETSLTNDQFKAPINVQKTPSYEQNWKLINIDLAYTYALTKGELETTDVDTFVAIGPELGFECDISTYVIDLPKFNAEPDEKQAE